MTRTCITALLALGLAATAATAATAAGGARRSATRTVTLSGLRFHPATLAINRGDSVRWVWRDAVDHNVTFHGFHSRTRARGTYTVRFSHRGSFSYVCSIHLAQGMRGKVVVR